MRALLLGFDFNVAAVQLTLELALFLTTKGAGFTEQVGYLFFGLGFHTGQKVQEKGFRVKGKGLGNGFVNRFASCSIVDRLIVGCFVGPKANTFRFKVWDWKT